MLNLLVFSFLQVVDGGMSGSGLEQFVIACLHCSPFSASWWAWLTLSAAFLTSAVW